MKENLKILIAANVIVNEAIFKKLKWRDEKYVKEIYWSRWKKTVFVMRNWSKSKRKSFEWRKSSEENEF